MQNQRGMSLQSILFHTAVLLSRLVFMTTASQFHCHGTCYKGNFDPTLHVQKDSALVGHSYRNISGKTDDECFGICINDCRCLAFQTQSFKCELLEDDRTTSGNDFQAMAGYNYYDIQQEFVQQDANNCLNGCCRSNPCLNGGSCIELCSDVKFKYSCACPLGYKGRVCEIYAPPSCLDVKTKQPLAASGVYTIHDTISGSSFQTYCDFSSEPNFVWTLIESFAFSNFWYFRYQPFDDDFPRNEASPPNWSDFRLAKTSMLFVRNQGTTHFRATCDFEKDSSDINADYLRGKITTLDILSWTPYSNECILYERVLVAGVGCEDCTADTWTGGYHLHLEDNSCKLSEMFNSVPDPRREYFGYYGNEVNAQHQCVMSDASTTQWWLGVQV